MENIYIYDSNLSEYIEYLKEIDPKEKGLKLYRENSEQTGKPLSYVLIGRVSQNYPLSTRFVMGLVLCCEIIGSLGLVFCFKSKRRDCKIVFNLETNLYCRSTVFDTSTSSVVDPADRGEILAQERLIREYSEKAREMLRKKAISEESVASEWQKQADGFNFLSNRYFELLRLSSPSILILVA